MSSKIGQIQLKRFAFGSAQDHLNEWQIGDVLVGKLSKELESLVIVHMKTSIERYVQASEKENQAITMLEKELG